MPLWRIFSHPTTFTSDQREALAKAITDLYVNYSKLPAFYVGVLFIDLDEHHVYVGGEKRTNWVRIAVEQVARTMPDPSTEAGAKRRKAWVDRVHEVIRPHILDREELDLELHIYDTPRDLWRIQGLEAPPPNSEAEKMWARENKAIPWTESGGVMVNNL